MLTTIIVNSGLILLKMTSTIHRLYLIQLRIHWKLTANIVVQDVQLIIRESAGQTIKIMS